MHLWNILVLITILFKCNFTLHIQNNNPLWYTLQVVARVVRNNCIGYRLLHPYRIFPFLVLFPLPQLPTSCDSRLEAACYILNSIPFLVARRSRWRNLANIVPRIEVKLKEDGLGAQTKHPQRSAKQVWSLNLSRCDIWGGLCEEPIDKYSDHNSQS